MATKVLSAKPGGKIRRRLLKETTDQKIQQLRKKLGLTKRENRWVALQFQVSCLQ